MFFLEVNLSVNLILLLRVIKELVVFLIFILIVFVFRLIVFVIVLVYVLLNLFELILFGICINKI